MNINFSSERDLVDRCINYFTDDKRTVYNEVPIFTNCVDLIILEEKTVTAIECKLSNWRRAIQQASKHMLVVDYSYVCLIMPKSIETREKIESSVNSIGIGLIYYDDNASYGLEFILAVNAKKSNLLWKSAKELLIRELEMQISHI